MLAKSPSKNLHFELLPFKKSFSQSLDLLPKQSTIAITCSASDKLNGIDTTLERAAEASNRGFKNIICHIAARQINSPDHLAQIAPRLPTRLLVVGGDRLGSHSPYYPDGLSLLREFAEMGMHFDGIGIPGYPRGYSNQLMNSKLNTDLKNKLKLLPHLTDHYYLESQFDFDAEVVIKWLQNINNSYPNLPVQIGLLGSVPAELAIQALSLQGSMTAARQLLTDCGLTETDLAHNQHVIRTIDLARQLTKAASSKDNKRIANLQGFTINTLNKIEACWQDFAQVEVFAKRLYQLQTEGA